jgi:hypothetical protein
MAFNPFAAGEFPEHRTLDPARGTIINIFRRRLHAQLGKA